MALTPETADGLTPDDAEYWNRIYAEEASPGWNLGGPAPPLVRHFEQAPVVPPPARALVPGCGFGHEVALLARLGYQTTALDIAPLALEGARSHLAAHGLSPRFQLGNLFELHRDEEHAGAYDVVVEHTCFCAIRPERRRDYALAVAGLLVPGGHLVGLFYNHGREGGPPFDTTEDHLRETFAGAFDILTVARADDSAEQRRDKELLAVLRRR